MFNSPITGVGDADCFDRRMCWLVDLAPMSNFGNGSRGTLGCTVSVTTTRTVTVERAFTVDHDEEEVG